MTDKISRLIKLFITIRVRFYCVGRGFECPIQLYIENGDLLYLKM